MLSTVSSDDIPRINQSQSMQGYRLNQLIDRWKSIKALGVSGQKDQDPRRSIGFRFTDAHDTTGFWRPAFRDAPVRRANMQRASCSSQPHFLT